VKYLLGLILFLPLIIGEAAGQQVFNDSVCNYLAVRGDRLSGDGTKISSRYANDTLRLFIEDCPFSTNTAFDYAWRAFGTISSCVTDMDTSNVRWLEYREWLKKVLYLNPDTMYYCADMDAMFVTFNYLIPGKGKDYNSLIAIMDYLLNSNHCPDRSSYLLEQRSYFRDKQIRIWKDGDTTIALDTSAVSIDSIGFSILKGPEFGAVTPRTYQKNFAELTATKNPFSDETILETSLADAAMLRLEVYDVLGKSLYTENQFFSAGKVQWKLDGRILPKGTLYVRVSTISGGVKTIKLVRE
jgi:hypothetical protein